MTWKSTQVTAKVVFTLGYDAPGYRVRKEDIEYMLYDNLVDLINSGAFKAIEDEVNLVFQVPTTVVIDIV